jgi:hypothetical protein
MHAARTAFAAATSAALAAELDTGTDVPSLDARVSYARERFAVRS